MSPSNFNRSLFFVLPAAWWAGVRLTEQSSVSATASVKLSYWSKNPFKSIFWAVQGMAAELSTGVLVMAAIKKSGKTISMLVLNNSANFSKKAKGRINFTCNDGEAMAQAIAKAVASGEGQTCWMTAVGTDAQGDVVSTFKFEWTVKVK